MQRYFLKQNYQAITDTSKILMEPDHFHHMVKVMRMQPQDHCFLVFHDGIAIEAEIISIKGEEIFLKEIGQETVQRELPIAVTIASGHPKGDKLEWIVQKGTELGAAAFLGFPAARSIVRWDEKKRLKKAERLQTIAREAAEQSHRQLLPAVTLLASEKELTALFANYTHVLIAYEESAKQGEHGILVQRLQSCKAGDSVLLVFGPEGGFTAQEIERYQSAGAVCCALGPRILRAETAPLYALSACSYQWELIG